MEQYIILLALNGVLVLTLSMLGGRWYSKAILTDSKEVAWRVVHSGGSMGGIMLIAFASVMPYAIMTDFWTSSFIWLIVSGTWFFIAAMFAAAITGHRGLQSTGSLSNRLINYTYLVAALLTLLGCGILIVGLVNAL